ncbi:methyltransferase [Parendozoicomonas sp. Alg238-R29]|uniref:methyltransferase n=1 Tax=Parendozoicomonas sp. Alg238-R29 TaxID=2993446 RepID=UPI00248DE6C5|nr:methyltransferase [Parendozoicomonas sp. Alg238-R29]
METLTSPFGAFQLQRLPVRNKETLRAWDAADEYLLNHLAELNLGSEHTGKVLVINDNFGALTLALAQHQPTCWSNSWLAHESIKHNAKLNGTDITGVRNLPSTEPLEFSPLVVCMKLPHNTCLLEEQLRVLRKAVPDGTMVIASDMAKHIHTSTLELFEKHFGPTTTSLARKKARLIFATVNKQIKNTDSPFPRTIEHNGMKLVNHAGVFSRQKLDIGTRFFLQHLPEAQQDATIIDLGCGNGALGVHIARCNSQGHIHFVDESYMSVQSAEGSWLANGLDDRAQFTTNDCLTGFPKDSANIIVCNPPFHQGNTVGDHIAWRMFQQSYDVLKKGGELRIIGNRHLGYHTKLKRLFGNCQTFASDNKFVVLSARKKA